MLTSLLTPPEHPHQHRHHPADDPAGPGAHRREPPLLARFLRPRAAPAPGSGPRTLRVAPCGAPAPVL